MSASIAMSKHRTHGGALGDVECWGTKLSVGEYRLEQDLGGGRTPNELLPTFDRGLLSFLSQSKNLDSPTLLGI